MSRIELRARESHHDFAVRFQSAHCEFAEWSVDIVIPGLMMELLGFQMLQGAKLSDNRESAVLKNAMTYESEMREQMKSGKGLDPLDLSLSDLMSD